MLLREISQIDIACKIEFFTARADKKIQNEIRLMVSNKVEIKPAKSKKLIANLRVQK